MNNMKITIEIPEEEIKDRLLDVIAKQYYNQWSEDRRRVDRVVSECIRKLIYNDKERIVDLIVARASRHTNNLAVKKLVEQMKEKE